MMTIHDYLRDLAVVKRPRINSLVRVTSKLSEILKITKWSDLMLSAIGHFGYITKYTSDFPYVGCRIEFIDTEFTPIFGFWYPFKALCNCSHLRYSFQKKTKVIATNDINLKDWDVFRFFGYDHQSKTFIVYKDTKKYNMKYCLSYSSNKHLLK